MTDKVKLICKTIKERAEYLRCVCKHSEANALLDLIPIIGPLQEDPKPKFKIGDTVIHVDDGADILYKEHKVVNVLELGYILDNGHSIEMEDQDDWELVEEPVSEELEKEVYEHLWKGRMGTDVSKPIYFSYDELLEVARHFADWQKQQMMKDAVDAFVYRGGIRLKEWPLSGARIEKTYPIKLIIIKQEEE